MVRTICTAAVDLQSLRSHYSFALCGLIAALLSKASEARPSFKDVLDEPFLQVTIGHVYKGLGPEVYAIQLRDGTRLSPPALASTTSPSPPERTGPFPPPPPRPPQPRPPPSQSSPPSRRTKASTPRPAQPSLARAAAPAAVALARGTEVHVAASILQRSFHRRFPGPAQPQGYSAYLKQRPGHNLER